MTYAPGTRVVVTEFIRRGEDADIAELDGWVIHHDNDSIIVANTPDYESLGDDMYWTATYRLSDVIVSPFSYPIDGEPKPARSHFGQWLFVVFIAGAALFIIGVLGRSWPTILGGVWLAAVPLIIAFFMGAKQGAHHS